MEIKYTTQGLLIYLTMATYLLALVVYIFRQFKYGRMIYFLGFANVPSETALALSVQFGIIGVLLWSIGLLFWLRLRL